MMFSSSIISVERARMLAVIPHSQAKTAGIAAGQAAAAAMIAQRANDGAGTPVPYTPLPGVGYWQPTPPGLAAAAFACGTFGLLVLPGSGGITRTSAKCAAGFAGLAWLSHGSVAFSFLALAPFAAWKLRRQWRLALPGTVIFFAMVGPWIAYQKIYDPPANRLFKWHLAGQSERDPRGTWETIRDSLPLMSAKADCVPL